MLQINNLSLGFGNQTVLDCVSFNIHSGERLGLVGRNGSGKTSLFKLITGELQPDEGAIGLPKNYTIGYLQQHLNFTESTILEEACLGLKEEEKDQSWKAEKILTGLGFSNEDYYKSPAEFSGGFQVRLNLAKVLLAEPHLLLLDEPTNYLDIISIKWLTKFLRQWPNELMLITHDRDFMNSVSTHTMAIHRNKIKKMAGDTEKLYAQIVMEEEIYELTRQKEEKTRKETMDFINRFRAQATRAKLVQSRIKALDKMGSREELGRVVELGFRFNSMPFHGQSLIRVADLDFGYTPERTLIENLDIEIDKKDRICVIGKNGKGKSTLLRLLAGELSPSKGRITLHPTCEMGYFGQTNIERLNHALTIEKELANVRPELSYSDIRKTCGAMMFSGDLALKKISILSGGEKSRVSLGKILLSPTNMLLLDEPTNHLDIESCDSMITALDDFSGAVVIVTHSEMFLHHLANRLIVFNEDRVFVFEGSYQDFLDKHGWESETKKSKKSKSGGNQRQDQRMSAGTFKKQRKGLLNKISKIEKEIDVAESELEIINQKMVISAGRMNGMEMKEMNQLGKQHQQTIDDGFATLEVLISELDVLDRDKP